MDSTLSLITGQQLRCLPHGLQIEGEISYEQWENILVTIHSIKSAYHCILADHINYGRPRFGVEKVALALEQAEFDLADVIKADAIGQLTFDFRQAHTLTSEHYFILSKIDSEKERSRWANIAIKEDLSPLELKRSVEAGRILHTFQIQDFSGHGSGINTIQGTLFKLQQWEREMGGRDTIIGLPSAERRSLLELLSPTIELASAIEQSLEKEEPYVG